MLNLKGKLLKIAYNNLSDINYENQHEFIKKYQSDLGILEILRNKLNFTYSLIHSNLIWGNLLANNTWTGIIGKLVSEVTCKFLFLDLNLYIYLYFSKLILECLISLFHMIDLM